MARVACSRADGPDLLRSSVQETLGLDPEKESPNVRPLGEIYGRQSEGEGAGMTGARTRMQRAVWAGDRNVELLHTYFLSQQV